MAEPSIFQKKFFVHEYISSNHEYDLEVLVRGAGALFVIGFKSSNIEPTVLRAQHQQHIDLGWRAIDLLLKPFESLILGLASQVQKSTIDLPSTYLYSKCAYRLEVKASTQDTQIVPLLLRPYTDYRVVDYTKFDMLDMRAPSAASLKVEEWTNVYSSDRISILNLDKGRETGYTAHRIFESPTKVLVDGKICFFKVNGVLERSGEIHCVEIAKYQSIKKATDLGLLASDLPICQLHGVIVGKKRGKAEVRLPQGLSPEEAVQFIMRLKLDEEAPRLAGLLFTPWIETGQTFKKDSLINALRSRRFPDDILRRWCRELDECVARLHDAGIVWGDASANNILVDNQDKIWLIDFGGSLTYGWVDEAYRETIEGDLQGLERIKAYIESHAANNEGFWGPGSKMNINRTTITRDLVASISPQRSKLGTIRWGHKFKDHGHGVAASTTIPAGSTIITLYQPYHIILDNYLLPDQVCSWCLLPGKETSEASVTKLLRCKTRKTPWYCDPQCQKEHWEFAHKNECPVYQRLAQMSLPGLLPTPVRALIEVLLIPDGARDAVMNSGLGESELERAIKLIVSDVLSKMKTNSFRFTSPTASGILFDPKLAMANHSCNPNSSLRCLGRTVHLTALREIKEFEQVFISYIDEDLPVDERKAMLKDRYFFDCVCEKCTEQTKEDHGDRA